MEIGERIHELRKTRGLTLQQLGDLVGVSASTVRKWETGFIENVRSDKIQKLAGALGVTGPYIMGWTDDAQTEYDDSWQKLYEDIQISQNAKTHVKSVPILGTIACGSPILAEENYEGLVYIDNSIRADFALRCKGDSMTGARIFDGDLVFIQQQEDVENGQIAAVVIGEDATLKRIYKHNDRIELRPENPLYPILSFQGPGMIQVRILGKAVAFLGTVR